jgi:hypothetical protein
MWEWSYGEILYGSSRVYIKWRFVPWESITLSRQFPEFINYNLP